MVLLSFLYDTENPRSSCMESPAEIIKKSYNRPMDVHSASVMGLLAISCNYIRTILALAVTRPSSHLHWSVPMR